MSDNENDSQFLQSNEDDPVDSILSNTNSVTVTKPKDKRRKRGSSHLSRKVKGGTKKTCTTSKRTTKTSKAEPSLATNAQSGATVKPKKPATKASSVLDSKKSGSKTPRGTKSSSAKSSQKVPAKRKSAPKSTDDSKAVIKQLRTDLKNAKKTEKTRNETIAAHQLATDTEVKRELAKAKKEFERKLSAQKDSATKDLKAAEESKDMEISQL